MTDKRFLITDARLFLGLGPNSVSEEGTRVVKLAGHLATTPWFRNFFLSSRRRVKINRVTLIYIVEKRSLALIQEEGKWRAFHSFLKGWVFLFFLFIFIEHTQDSVYVAECWERRQQESFAKTRGTPWINSFDGRRHRVDLKFSSHSWCSRNTQTKNDWSPFLGSRFKIRSPFKSSSIRERLKNKRAQRPNNNDSYYFKLLKIMNFIIFTRGCSFEPKEETQIVEFIWD